MADCFFTFQDSLAKGVSKVGKNVLTQEIMHFFNQNACEKGNCLYFCRVKSADRLLHGLTAFSFEKRVDRLRHGLTTRFFYVFKTVLNMLPIHFLSDDQFDGKIHVIKTFAVKSMSEFD